MPFIDPGFLESLNHELSIGRINTDARTDFIYAPHISAIYAKSGKELFERLLSDVKSDRFHPGLPITLETPKKSGLTRPGSILEPLSRLMYQLLADHLSDICEGQIDRGRVYSQIPLHSDPDYQMFAPASDCYSSFASATEELAHFYNVVVQTDISSYFERIYQHNLINFLTAAGADPSFVTKPLERLLGGFTTKDSHGLVQGVFPSDLLGNVYLCPLDAELANQDISSCRYVDDIYMFFAKESEAKKVLASLCQHLRREGLNLNESKTRISPVLN